MNLIQMNIISTIIGKNPLREMEQLSYSAKESKNAVLGWNLKTDRMISAHFQGKSFNIIVIQIYTPTDNVEEAEAE